VARRARSGRAAAHPEYADLIWAWAHRSEEMVAGPIDGTVELLRALRAKGVPCYALTNMERETYPGRVDRYPFMRWFEGTVVSAYENLIKPDPRIFELLLDRFALEPGETAMIDDSPVNLEAARSVGMQTVHFESPDQLRRWLESAGCL
jgi:2-haloacid dehalogenase